MTRDRFMQLAGEHLIAESYAEVLWDKRPAAVDDYTDEQVVELFRLTHSPLIRTVLDLIDQAVKIVHAHEDAARN